LELYEESRRMMEFEKMKVKFAKAIKWDLVRKKRSELFRIRVQTNQRIRQKCIQMNLVFRINRMKYKFKKQLLRYRKTVQARLL